MINNVVIVGNLTKDLELKKTGSGKSVVSFDVAVNDKFNKEEVDFISCVAWNQTADFMAKYLGKGSKVGIEGRLKKRSYENSKGDKVYVTEIIANSVQSLSSRNEKVGEVEEPVLSIQSDDLPF